MSRHVSIPINTLTAVNTLKWSVGRLIDMVDLNISSRDFSIVQEYCKADTKFCQVVFEFLMSKLSITQTRSYFQLIFFLFEKSKTIKQLVAPRIHDIFARAMQVDCVRLWSITALSDLDDKYGDLFPTIRSEATNRKFEKVKIESEQHELFVKQQNEKEYQNVLLIYEDWIEKTKILSRKFESVLENIVVNFLNSEREELSQDEKNRSDGLEVNVCSTSYGVFQKYKNNYTKRVEIEMREVLERADLLRGIVWKGYVAVVLVQCGINDMSEEELQRYKTTHSIIIDIIDNLDDILYKGRELKLI
ncbi:hypothetical protein EIN_251170 [Entamoeba invadens IP1]|uniref:Uncharacterized protein n=1 Tax=Entamoeba invadens IP1 TaxID=370355 RepID=A0A0A1UER0_ENTIV|nr:hypothetical protein EIN_251170 [Entamoeba invadens IP1]ELP94973.1 hypothetical protein EIN_251170 [Entamoeba invadens IP1]|eukprot:XP_004261744.1 hypothetical protein EIN_251170 [Entamoeba invadens IP1]